MQDFNRVPGELRSFKQFVVWKYEDTGQKKPAKVPYEPVTGKRADVTNPNTWDTYENAVANAQYYDGIGFVLTENDPYCFVDLDDTDDPQTLAAQQKYAVELDSYSERSVSGTGLHIIVRGTVPTGGARSKGIEIYSNRRYMTMTGDVYRNGGIAPRQNIIDDMVGFVGKKPKQFDPTIDIPSYLTDRQIYDRAMGAKNGPLFATLWAGSTAEHQGDHSAADQALMNILAFYTQERQQLFRLFRMSPLAQRPKSQQRDDYVNYTINTALDQTQKPIDVSGFLAEFNKMQAELDLDKVEKVLIGHSVPAVPKHEVSEPVKAHFEPPPGFLGDIAEFCYAQQWKQIGEYAVASALGVFAGMAGRAYVNGSDGLNLFILALGKTGCGKSGIGTGINKVLQSCAYTLPGMADFLGPGLFQSGSAMINYLATSNTKSFVCMQDEFVSQLQEFHNPRQGGQAILLKRLTLELYSLSQLGGSLHGTAYADSQRNLPPCRHPAVSIINQGTNSEFFSIVTHQMLVGGYLPRHIILDYTGDVPMSNEASVNIQLDESHADHLRAIGSHCLNTLARNARNPIHRAPGVDAEHLEYAKFVNDIVNDPTNPHLAQLWNRSEQNIMRVAGLIAVGKNFGNPLIDLETYNWSKNFIVGSIQKFISKLDTSDAFLLGEHNIEKEQEDLTIKAIGNYLFRMDSAKAYKAYKVPSTVFDNKVIPLSYFTSKLRNYSAFKNDARPQTMAIKIALQRLEDNGLITKLSLGNAQAYGTSGVLYMPDIPKVQDLFE